MDFGGYSVKVLRTFTGREGVGCNATLYKDGKKVGTIDDMADGGGVYADFDGDAPRDAFDAHLKSLPAEKRSWSEDVNVSLTEDMFLNALIEEALKAREAKKMLKMLAKKTVFVLKGDDKGSYRVMNVPFDERVKAAVVKAHGDRLEVIFNESPDKVAAFLNVAAA